MLAYTTLVLFRFLFLGRLTVSAGLDGCLDVANTLNRKTVLVVSVDELILQFTNLINQNSELVGDIGNVIVASFAPDGELLLC